VAQPQLHWKEASYERKGTTQAEAKASAKAKARAENARLEKLYRAGNPSPGTKPAPAPVATPHAGVSEQDVPEHIIILDLTGLAKFGPRS
jgi:hypothetical protein